MCVGMSECTQIGPCVFVDMYDVYVWELCMYVWMLCVCIGVVHTHTQEHTQHIHIYIYK